MKKHGMSNTKLYRCWSGMKQRCLNPKDTEYPNYGGRGVSVCNEWIGFESFARWALSNGYADGLTIERMDVNGNYCPENCTWATLKEQMNNKRNNIVVETEIGRMTLAEYCDKKGMDYNTVQMRYYRGFGLELPKNFRHRQVIRDDGEAYETIAEAALKNGVVESRIRAVCNGERKLTAGHSFRYLTREEAEAALRKEQEQ